jgi:hypothetical protein
MLVMKHKSSGRKKNDFEILLNLTSGYRAVRTYSNTPSAVFLLVKAAIQK